MEDVPVEQISYSIAFAIFGCSATSGYDRRRLYTLFGEYFSATYVKNAVAPYMVR